MSDLLVGLLSAVLSTNPPAAVSNLVAEKTGVSVQVVNTNDPVEMAYRKILEDDDAAEKDVIKWTDDAGSLARGDAQLLILQSRIRQRLQGIKTEYEDFVAHHPDHAHIRLAYGSFLNDTHDEEGAVAQWEKARELDPKNPAAWNNLANYYGHRSPVKKAFEYYAKAIELDDKEAVYYENLATTVYLFRVDAEEYYHLNETQVFDKALELYRKAIALDPDNFVLFSDYAESFYGTKPPRWQDGLAAWTQALKIAHDDVERQGVYIHLARIHWKLGHYEEACRSLNVVTNAMYATLKTRLTRNLIDDAISDETVTKAAFAAILNEANSNQAMGKVAFAAMRAADNTALEALQKIGREYKDFKAADASAANVRPESFSLRVVGGLHYFTQDSGGKVGAVKLSEQGAQKSKVLLEKCVTQTVQAQTNANSPWQLLVQCNQSTGAKLGAGTVWKSIPSVESDKDLKGVGLALGSGGPVQTLVTGSLFLLNTREKLLVLQKDVSAAGSDMESALRGFANAINTE